MIVDAHHHLWDPGRADYPWLTDELAPIRRAFGPADLAPLLESGGVERPSSSRRGRASTRRASSSRPPPPTPFIRGVVGWVDLTDPAVEDTIAALRAGPGGDRLVGIRHQVHDEPDPDWLRPRRRRRGIAAVGPRRPRLRPARPVARAAGRSRARRVDAGRPVRRRPPREAADPRRARSSRGPTWSASFAGLAERRMEAHRPRHRGGLGATGQPADLAPYVDHVLDVLGAGPADLRVGLAGVPARGDVRRGARRRRAR